MRTVEKAKKLPGAALTKGTPLILQPLPKKDPRQTSLLTETGSEYGGQKTALKEFSEKGRFE